MSRLLAEAEALYALDLGDFTPTRDARAKDLRAEDRDLAAAVKALRKPSTAAWVVNLLVRRETEQVDQLLEVGAALRRAQAGLDADQLRALTRERRQVTAAVTTRARALARERGHKVTDAVAEQVEATLTAAMLDEGCGAAVRSGMLLTALETTGVDTVDAAGAVAVPQAIGHAATPVEDEPPGPPDLHVVPDPDADRKAREEARERLEEAQAELDRAVAEQEEAAESVSRLQARSLQLQSELEELRRRIAEHEEQLDEVDGELEEAEGARTEADDAVSVATRARDEVAEEVERLGSD